MEKEDLKQKLKHYGKIMREEFKILVDWTINVKGWELDGRNSKQVTFGYTREYIILYPTRFPLWVKLRSEGYSDDQLIRYFNEVVRVSLPELIGTRMQLREGGVMKNFW
jgi:hypothetical protein